MKMTKKEAQLALFTTDELFNELRNRKIALGVWSLDDTKQMIDDIKEDDEDYKNLEMPEEIQYQIIVNCFEKNDKFADNEFLRSEIIDAWYNRKSKNPFYKF